VINRLYTVSATVTAVVMATSELEAERRFKSDFGDIIADQDIDAECGDEIRNEDQLPNDWNVDCLPYGPNSNTLNIGQFLDILPPAVVRDTATVDMFAGTSKETA
jgi:hypothetical protein